MQERRFGGLVLVEQRLDWQLDKRSRLQALVDVRQDFHHLAAHRLSWRRDLQQHRREKLDDGRFEGGIRVGCAQPEQDAL